MCIRDRVVVGRRGRGGHVQAVVVVELEFLLRREVAADAEVGGLLDEGAVEGHPQRAVHQLTRLQGHERVPAEQTGADGRPFGDAGGVVEIDLVDGADPGAVAVERLAADQVARVYLGTHGPSTWSYWGRAPADPPAAEIIRSHYERAHRAARPLEGPCGDLAGTLATAADPVRESPPGITGGAEGANPPRNLSGSRTARTRSLWKAGRVSTASALTDGESRESPRAPR